VNNTTLLHFLERTVAKHFLSMEEFLEELGKPAEAYRVNLQDVRKGLTELRDGLKAIRQELNEHFSEIEQNDRYSKQMWGFLGKATRQMEDLNDDVNAADTLFTEVVRYFGEDEKNMSSAEFYGIFKTFVTSYRKCQIDNRTAAEEKHALEKRKRAAEEAKANRKKVTDEALAQEAEETAALDNLLEKLRNGDNVGRRARRARPSAASISTRGPALLQLPEKDKDLTPVSALGGTTADIARGMLEQLKTNGFVSETFTPLSPVTSSAPRRRRLRTGNLTAAFAAELEAAGNPLLLSPESPGFGQHSAGLGSYEDDGSDTGRED